MKGLKCNWGFNPKLRFFFLIWVQPFFPIWVLFMNCALESECARIPMYQAFCRTTKMNKKTVAFKKIKSHWGLSGNLVTLESPFVTFARTHNFHASEVRDLLSKASVKLAWLFLSFKGDKHNCLFNWLIELYIFMLHIQHLEAHILCKDQNNFFTASGIDLLTVHYTLLLPSQLHLFPVKHSLSVSVNPHPVAPFAPACQKDTRRDSGSGDHRARAFPAKFIVCAY